MKRRLDFVTNSSSSSYIIALYKDKPEIEKTRCFANMPISKCNVSAIENLWNDFSDYVSDNLYMEIYDKGMTEEIRTKYYQFLFWERFGNSFCYTSRNKPEAERILEAINELEHCIKDGYLLSSEKKDVKIAYPMIPEEKYNWKLEHIFAEYIDIYYRDEMIAYLESTEKSYETLVKWFENLTGCTWVITCGWEDDDPPKGIVMCKKSDDGDAFLDG